MVDLTAKTACDGLLPRRCGPLRLEEMDLGVMTLVVGFKPASPSVSKAIETAHGIPAPSPGHATGQAGCRAIWFGKDQILLAGPVPDARLADVAAVSDQSDAWAAMVLSGAGAVDVLSRLVPIDVRPEVFGEGQTARTLIGHLSASVTCLGADRFLLLGFRSMAGTLVHEVSEAMETIVART